MKEIDKKLLSLSIDDIKPYANNPRFNENAVEAVKESISQCEYIAPIIVDENNEILAGHTRYKALIDLGEAEIEVLKVSGLTQAQKRKYRLLDNKTNEFAHWDFEKLAEEIQSIDFESFDFGFDNQMGNISIDEMFEETEKTTQEKEEELIECPNCKHRFKK